MSETEYRITQKEAADYLDVSTKTISRYRKKGLPYRLMLNPVTGKQEVRFREKDLERWSEGRDLLATHGREGQSAAPEHVTQSSSETAVQTTESGNNDYLQDLLAVYKDQIALLKDQLADMREQLARRDRQIDDLMRLMVGLQLEYKPVEEENHPMEESISTTQPSSQSGQSGKRVFSEEEISTSILRLRQRGKSYAEIARGLNQINAATISGKDQWTEAEVQSLLPPVISGDDSIIEL